MLFMLESCCTYLLKLLSYSWKVKYCTVSQWRGWETQLFGLTIAMFGPMVYRETHTHMGSLSRQQSVQFHYLTS